MQGESGGAGVTWRGASVLFWIVIAVAGASCTGRIRAYDGPPRQPDTVAILKDQYGIYSPRVYFIRVDNVAFGRKRFADLELLPGRHEVEFGFEESYGHSTTNAVVVFDAEANHQYEAQAEPFSTPFSVRAVFLGSSGNWKPRIVDITSGAAVDVPIFTPPAHPAPAADRSS